MSKTWKEYTIEFFLPAMLISYGICGAFDIPYSKICFFFILIAGIWTLFLTTLNLVKK